MYCTDPAGKRKSMTKRLRSSASASDRKIEGNKREDKEKEGNSIKVF